MNSQIGTVNILNIPFADGGIVRERCYPYLAYVNGAGNPCGKMFQSFLFDLSGGKNKADWERGVDRLFAAEGGGIGELDSAAGDVKKLLGLDENASFDVYVKAPLPEISLKLFGDINGDGIAEKLLDAEDCLKAVSLFAGDVIRHFVIGNYKNLSFKGFVLEPGGDGGILNACVEYLAEKGISVFAENLKSVEISEKTLFSELSNFDEEIRIFAAETPEFVLNCAFAKNGGLRDIYDSLFLLLNPEKFLNSDEGSFVEETVAEEEPKIEVASEEKGTDAESPVIEETTSEEEIIAAEEAVAEEASPRKTRKCKFCEEIKLTQKQKNALIGAGIAAATLGLAYLVGKLTKDR